MFRVWGQGQVAVFPLCGFCVVCGAVPEAEAVVSGFEDVTMVGQAVEQRRRHLGIAEDARPFREAEVGGDDDAGPLVEPAQQMEQQGAARCAERQITEFIEDDEIGVDEPVGDLARSALSLLLFQCIDGHCHGNLLRLAASSEHDLRR
jgi:hypothetical protein